MRVLTKEGQEIKDEFDDEFEYRSCVCHLGYPPCSYCTHPGNPESLSESPDLWIGTGGRGEERRKEALEDEHNKDRRITRIGCFIGLMLFIHFASPGMGILAATIVGILGAALSDMVSATIYPSLEGTGYCESYQPLTTSWLKPWEL